MLRPFPSPWLLAATPPGRAGHEDPATGSFPRVSGLSQLSAVCPSCLHRFCCRVAVDRPRVPLPVAMTLYCLTRSGSESEIVRIGVSLGAPFLESGQLRSHDTPTAIGVETDQPREWPRPEGRDACGCQVLGCQESASQGYRRGETGRPPARVQLSGVGVETWPAGPPDRPLVG